MGRLSSDGLKGERPTRSLLTLRLTLTRVKYRIRHLYRVNFEVNNLKPFPYLAFPHSIDLKTARKWPSFDGELMASFPGPSPSVAAGFQDCWCNRDESANLAPSSPRMQI